MSTRGDFEDVFSVYVPIGAVVVLVVFAVLGYALIRYRRRPGRRPSRRHEATAVELLFALVLAGTATVLIVTTFTAESREDQVSARAGLDVDVVASQWRWAFGYPRLGIAQGTSQELVLPAGVRVRIALTSLDVIHSFYVPQQRFKRDAFPDHTTVFDMTFAHPGRHVGRCAEFCGLLHAQMTFVVRVLAPSDFRAWAARERRIQAAADGGGQAPPQARSGTARHTRGGQPGGQP